VKASVDTPRVVTTRPQGIRRSAKHDRESGVTTGVASTAAESSVMASTATKFDEVNSQLQSMLTTLMNELSTLESAWKGLGAQAFEQVKQQYAADLKSLNQALSETAESIRISGQQYDSTDTDAASKVANSGGSFSLPL
jgi:WXG100 family type VII secretion target